jgi:hypothetical protein
VGLAQDFVINPMLEGMASERFFIALFGRFKSYPKLTAAAASNAL